MREYIATFYSHYGAVCFRKNCQKLGLEAAVMPVPRNLSSSCGTCVKFKTMEQHFPELNEELEQIAEILEVGYRIVYRAEE